MRLRAEYYAGPDLRFLSNLDMKRMMERSLRRSGLPYALSEGFNPQIKLSMGTVLPVGVWSQSEYFDIELIDYINPLDFVEIMNRVLPTDIRIKDCVVINDKTPALMKVINSACYGFMINSGLELLEIKDKILKAESLVVKSKGKKKDLDKDLRPGIYNIEIEKALPFDIIKIWVSVGEPVNVRYDELVNVLAVSGLNYADILDIFRVGNFIKVEDVFYNPLEKVS